MTAPHIIQARTVNGRKKRAQKEEEVVRKQQERFQKQVKMKGVLKRDGFCGFVVLVLDERDGWMDGWMDG